MGSGSWSFLNSDIHTAQLRQKSLQVVCRGKAAGLTPAAYRVSHAAIVSSFAGLQRVAKQCELRLKCGDLLLAIA